MLASCSHTNNILGNRNKMPRSRGFGGDSRSRGRGFESHHPLLDGHIVRFKKKLKLTKKRTGIVHFKMPQMRKITIIDRRIQIS